MPRGASVPQPTPAARVVFGRAYRVARKPEGIASPLTASLQAAAKRSRSQLAPQWGVFPVFGRELVVAGYLSARTPRAADAAWAIEPGGTLAPHHAVVPFVCSEGASVGPQRDERCDADCVDDFLAVLAATEAWRALGAEPVDALTLPGGAHLEGADEPAFFLLTDDGRGADVAHGMSFWRAGATYAEGRVETWTRPVGDEVVRVVGVRLARVDGDTPLAVAPPWRGPAMRHARDAIVRETRAVLDSPRPFASYFIADD